MVTRLLRECSSPLAEKFGGVGLGHEESEEEHLQAKGGGQRRISAITVGLSKSTHRSRKGEHDPEEESPRIAELSDESSYSRADSRTEKAVERREVLNVGTNRDERRGSRAEGKDGECHGAMRSREHIGDDSTGVCKGRRAEEPGEEAADEEGLNVLCSGTADVEQL